MSAVLPLCATGLVSDKKSYFRGVSSFPYIPCSHQCVHSCLLLLFCYFCCPKALGIVHVLTGPDHLSAIATLSVNVGNFRAFWYGVRWGVGHSIGLVSVGSIFIILENIAFDNGSSSTNNSDNNSSRVIEIPEKIENLAACFVGIFMLGLGSYNLYWAHRTRKEKKQKGHCHHHHCEHKHHHYGDDEEQKGQLSCDSLTEKTDSISNYGDRLSNSDDGIILSPKKDPMGIDNDDGANNKDIRDSDVSSKQYLSLCVGLFHGIAGPGG